MTIKSKNASLVILAIASIVFIRAMLWFFHDPEGPNLLVVLGMASVVYVVSLMAYLWKGFPQKFLLALLIQILLVGSLYFYFTQGEPSKAFDERNSSFVINGKTVTLVNGAAVEEAAPGSASQIRTNYFGNELRTDLNGDGREDVAFIITQNTGGSGTFYYAVAALNLPEGYVGSDGYLLGDRIAPQSTNLSTDPSQKYVVVFNYADRTPGEPMTARPSVGKSAYLKLNPQTLQWGVVLSPEERKAL